MSILIFKQAGIKPSPKCLLNVLCNEMGFTLLLGFLCFNCLSTFII